jgi:adenosylcobyric acid synthase
MRARALMILGTSSHVGKSLLTAALGRILTDDGFRVAPFKAQNMSLNSAATPDGREIGRAQALQAEACRIAPTADMNPILLKPSSDTGAQVVVLGRVWGQLTAANYHQSRVEELFPVVVESYRKLAAEYDIMLVEGAGSPAEINLKAHDIVNMRMARAADADCILVGDIDRGGVFASLLGTMELLEPGERAMVRAFVINKFRGDIDLLLPGIAMIEERLGIPCAGVVPYLRDVGLEEEDSVALEDRNTVARAWSMAPGGESSLQRPLRIGVIAFPHMANFTDFDALALEPSVALAFLDRPEQIGHADLLILPGSKQTLDDLAWLHANGFAPAIAEFHARTEGGAGVAGICGGMQMLGKDVQDPTGVESDGRSRLLRGLGLLPIATVLRGDKTTCRVSGAMRKPTLFGGQPLVDHAFEGYEIHLGETIYDEHAQPFADIQRRGATGNVPDGARSADGFVFGTYVHGLFDHDAFRHAFLDAARRSCGLTPAPEKVFVTAEREKRIDRLADHVRGAIDLPLIKSWLSEPAQSRAEGSGR